MISKHSLAVAQKAKALFEARLRAELESMHRDEFVAIEPESGDFFLGPTYSASVTAARGAHPNRISFVIRIGHKAALQLGEITN